MFWFMVSPFLFLFSASVFCALVATLRRNQVLNKLVQRLTLFLFGLVAIFPVAWLIIGSTPGKGFFIALLFAWMLLAGTDPLGYGHHPRLR